MYNHPSAALFIIISFLACNVNTDACVREILRRVLTATEKTPENAVICDIITKGGNIAIFYPPNANEPVTTWLKRRARDTAGIANSAAVISCYDPKFIKKLHNLKMNKERTM